MEKLKELRDRLARSAVPTGAYDRHVGTTLGALPCDGSSDGRSDPGSPEKGRQMAADLEARKTAEHQKMDKQNPMECVKRALGVEK